MYAKIDRRIWSDAKFLSLSGPARLLVFYLLTSNHSVPLPGVVHISEEGVAAELGWTLEKCRERFGELYAIGFVKPYPNYKYFWMPNSLKYNFPPNENVLKSYKKQLEMIPGQLRFDIKRSYKKTIKLLKPEWLSMFEDYEPLRNRLSYRNTFSSISISTIPKTLQFSDATAPRLPQKIETVSKPNFNIACHDATMWVCGQLGLSGQRIRKSISDALTLEHQTSNEELSTIAEIMVRARRSYDETVRTKGTGYLYPPRKFFEEGVWKSSRAWRDHKSNGDATTDTTNDDETD
jgi:hypothetical protein